MNPTRPPSGGLFRLSGPAARSQPASDARGEARQAIRDFVRALEKLDRAPEPRKRSAPSRARPR